ncbi:MAG TPA: hypothetical protein VFQ13_20535, partial [Anaerolineales bacterium]|nr:hypothetical protein [Anaerolineales bacterium]
MSTNRFFTVLIALVLVTLMALAPQATAFAGQSVDPATLNPPIPPEFNPECQAVGFGTLCSVDFVEIQGPDASGIICGTGASSFDVVVSDTRTVTGQRYYDENGDLTQRHFRQVLVGTFINPLTGASLDYAESTTIIHDLTVPGDLSTGTENFTGSIRLSLPQGGTVLIDAGKG